MINSPGFLLADRPSFWPMSLGTAVPLNSPDRSVVSDLVAWIADSAATGASWSSCGVKARANLRLLMPFPCDRKQSLLLDRGHVSGDEAPVEKYLAFLFLLSNKFVQIGFSQQEGVDQTVLKLLRGSGANLAQRIKDICSTYGVATEAIAEALFGTAVRSHDITRMKIFLDAGLDPDIQIDGRLKALEFSAAIRDEALSIQMTHLLLSYQSSVSRQRALNSALVIAIQSRKIGLCKLLLGAGAWTTHEAINACVTLYSANRDFHILKIIFNAHVEINQLFKLRSGTKTLLGFAVELDNIPIAESLLLRNADASILQEIYFEDQAVYTSIIGLAARKGLDNMVHFLLNAHVNVNAPPTECAFISPIALGISGSHRRTVELLTRAGAHLEANEHAVARTLIQRAVGAQDWELSRGLLQPRGMISLKGFCDFYTLRLMYSLSEGDFDTTSTLLGLGARVNDLHSRIPNTALGASIMTGRLDLIDLVLMSGAQATGYDLLTSIPNVETAKHLDWMGVLPWILASSGQILLTTSIFARNTEVVQYLLSQNVDKQDHDNLRWQKDLLHRTLSRASSMRRKLHRGLARFVSPVEAAITCGNTSLALLLLGRGGPVTESVLNAAVWNYLQTHSDNILREVLARTPEDFCAPSAVAMAAYASDIPLLGILLAAGINPTGEPKVMSRRVYEDMLFGGKYSPPADELGWWHDCLPLQGHTALIIPAVRGDRVILSMLLNSAPWSSPEVGRALTYCLYFGNFELMHDLLGMKSDLDQPLEIFATRLAPICCALKHQDPSLVRMLISHGSSVNPVVTSSSVCTPLQRAVEMNDVESVRMLIAAGADINAPPPSFPGATALQIAVKEGSLELIDVLLAAGADIEANYGATALQFAAIMGYIGILYKLLAVGANIDAPRAQFYGRTALEGAAENGRIDMLQVLLNEGARVDWDFRPQYVRAVKLAESNGHFAAARLLKQAGGWTELDSLQYEVEVFDQDEFEKFKRDNPNEVSGLRLCDVRSGHLFDQDNPMVTRLRSKLRNYNQLEVQHYLKRDVNVDILVDSNSYLRGTCSTSAVQRAI